jgi:predicted nucleotidyltransferase
MLYQNYLEVLLGSRVKVKILRTLCRHRGKEFTIRELADFLNVSHTGVRKVLSDLYKMNAVRIRVIGKSHAVTVNTESYAAGLVDKVFKMEGETLRELVKLVAKKLGDPSITSALIFGSVARGEEEPLSDIDLFILTEDKEKAESAVSELQREVSNRFGNAISPYVLSEEDLADEDKLQILEEIRKKHIVVRGKPLG